MQLKSREGQLANAASSGQTDYLFYGGGSMHGVEQTLHSILSAIRHNTLLGNLPNEISHSNFNETYVEK